MKLSTRGRYAVMAMADIAHHSSGEPYSLGDIASAQDISLAYLEQLVRKAPQRGIGGQCAGPGGGYHLARPASDIRIADIVMAVDEPLKVTRCEEFSPKGCVGGARCLTHDLWEELGRQIHVFLAAVSLADVVNKRVLGMAAPLCPPAAGQTVEPEAVQ